MKKELEEAKKNYLRYIETKYSPPTSERDNHITYRPTSDYTGQYFPYRPIPSAVDIKNRRRGMIIIPLFFMMWFMANQEASAESKARMTIAFIIFLTLTMLIAHFIPGSKIHLRLTIHGIWLRDEDHVIKWKHLLQSHIKEDRTDNESTSYALVLHYYDERTDTFRSYEKPLDGLMVTEGKISYLIGFFKKLSENNNDYNKDE
jgi:hypothetical protein